MLDAGRGMLYVADSGNGVVRAIALADPTDVRTIAGLAGTQGCATASGNATGDPATALTRPVALALDHRNGNALFVVDEACHLVRRIDLREEPPQSHRVLGIGGPGTPAAGIGGQVALFRPSGASGALVGLLALLLTLPPMFGAAAEDQPAYVVAALLKLAAGTFAGWRRRATGPNMGP